MNLGKVLICGSLLLSSLLADISNKGIVGDWEINSLFDDGKIVFNEKYKDNFEVNFKKNGTIIIDGDSKYYMLDNNILTIGNSKKGEVVHEKIEEYELMDNVMERFAYGKKCFELKIKKIEDGLKSKNRMKICTEF
jgi:hypothetical protein